MAVEFEHDLGEDARDEDDMYVCQICGGPGDKHETLTNDGGNTEHQLWVYCESCKAETFYDLPDEQLEREEG